MQIVVGNLGTSILGLEAGGVITINQTAAGYNWYVGAGSASNQSFALAGPGGESIAAPGSAAASEVDLLTVLEHELGHVIGLADNAEAGDLMDITLGLGVRRAPTSADVAAMAGNGSETGLAVPAATGTAGPRQSALVDAALESILGGIGNGTNSPVSPVGPAVSMGPVASPGTMPRKKNKNRPADFSSHVGLFSSRFVRKANRLGQASVALPRSR